MSQGLRESGRVRRWTRQAVAQLVPDFGGAIKKLESGSDTTVSNASKSKT
jgi:hypothetical protein